MSTRSINIGSFFGCACFRLRLGCPQILRRGLFGGLRLCGFLLGLGFFLKYSPHRVRGLGLRRGFFSRGGILSVLFLNLSGLLFFHQRGGRRKFGLDGVADADLGGLGLRGREVCPRLSVVKVTQCDIHERPLAGNKFPHRQRATPGEGGVIAGSNGANIRTAAQG